MKSKKSFVVKPLGELCEVTGGNSAPQGEEFFKQGTVPFVRMRDLGAYHHTTSLEETRDAVNEAAIASKRLKIFEPGCILFPRSGSVALNHRAILGVRACIVSHIGILQGFSPEVDRRYLYWFLVSYDMGQIAKQTTGLDLVGFSDVKKVAVPLTTLVDQRRIVAEIEKQFTRLDSGVAALHRVQANLKRYRAAVLKAACEGRLVPTEAELARQERRTFETGEQLLQRILAERRKNWTGRGSEKGPSIPDPRQLATLPAGWAWASLDALAAIKGGITKDQKRKHSAPTRSVPYLRVANVQRGYLDLTEIKEITATESDIEELRLQPSDILFNEGGDRDKLGRGWIWSGELSECVHQNHVFRARPLLADLNPKYVSWYANTFGQKFFFDEGKHTTNLASISMTKLKALPVPIPPPAEQKRIVTEVERRLSVVDKLEALVIANLGRGNRLRRTILQQTFGADSAPNSKIPTAFA